jgi:hypothetical protein
MPRSGVRRTPSVYARPPSATATGAGAQAAAARSSAHAVLTASDNAAAALAANRSSDSDILRDISVRMTQFADSLAASQRSSSATEALLVEKLAEHRRLIDGNRSAALAENKALSSTLQVQFQQSAPNFSWRSKGNKAQHVYNCTVLNNWLEAATALENEDFEAIKKSGAVKPLL